MRPLSKSILLAFRQCPKRLWLELHGPKAPAPDAQTQARFDDGHQVGKIAQTLYDPKGKGVIFNPDKQGYDEVVLLTDELIDSSQPLFEAGFNAGGARAYVDVMLPRRKNGKRVWHMVEVKSTSEVKDTHKDDIAIQAHIARASGVVLQSAAVAHIDSQWVYPGNDDYREFLVEVDLTQEAFGRDSEVKQWISDAQAIARKRKEPDIAVGHQCAKPYACAFLDYCQREASVAEFPVAWLPRPSPKLKARLEEEGVLDLIDVPDEYLNPQQLRVKSHTVAGTVYFDTQAALTELAKHKLPAYFLDFETINLTVPIWKGVRPFQQIPFQFSLHRLSRTGALSQREFLNLSGQDPSRLIAEALISACGERGPIFVYSSFESARIRELAKRLPKLARVLLAINERLVDLLPVAQKHYYHPDQQGSWSIKSVLPTIAPDLRYDELDDVQDGGSAIQVYREAIHHETSPARKAKIQRQLLDYCRLDTLAMVRVWQHFTCRATL